MESNAPVHIHVHVHGFTESCGTYVTTLTPAEINNNGVPFRETFCDHVRCKQRVGSSGYYCSLAQGHVGPHRAHQFHNVDGACIAQAY